MSLSQRHLGLLAIVFATFCWGAGTTITKQGLSDTTIQEGYFFCAQIISAWFFMLILQLFSAQKILKSGEYKFSWLGVLEPGLAYAFGVVGLKYTIAIHATVIGGLESFIILLCTFLIFKKTITKKSLILGICLFFATLTVSLSSIDNTETSKNMMFGDFLEFLGVSCAALYVSLSNNLIPEESNWQTIIFWQLTVCFGLVLVYFMFKGANTSLLLSHFNIYSISSGIITYSLSFVLYFWGCKHISHSLSAFLINLIPIFGVALSVILLKENLNLIGWAGFFMAIVFLVLLTNARE
jgi:drug/metabolite transporter (DMT)-like permease